MKLESLPPIKSVYHALENAAVDVYGFAVACHGGAVWMAEPAVLDALLLGLENFWFVEGEDGQLSHQEFREEIFRTVWEKCQEKATPVHVGTDVPMGHEEMAFYRLPQIARAVIFLRTKRRFTYASIAAILGLTEPMARGEVERAREFLLGRGLRAVEWNEEIF